MRVSPRSSVGRGSGRRGRGDQYRATGRRATLVTPRPGRPPVGCLCPARRPTDLGPNRLLEEYVEPHAARLDRTDSRSGSGTARGHPDGLLGARQLRDALVRPVIRRPRRVGAKGRAPRPPPAPPPRTAIPPAPRASREHEPHDDAVDRQVDSFSHSARMALRLRVLPASEKALSRTISRGALGAETWSGWRTPGGTMVSVVAREAALGLERPGRWRSRSSVRTDWLKWARPARGTRTGCTASRTNPPATLLTWPVRLLDRGRRNRFASAASSGRRFMGVAAGRSALSCSGVMPRMGR
jgi:hypothetical protein